MINHLSQNLQGKTFLSWKSYKDLKLCSLEWKVYLKNGKDTISFFDRQYYATWWRDMEYKSCARGKGSKDWSELLGQSL